MTKTTWRCLAATIVLATPAFAAKTTAKAAAKSTTRRAALATIARDPYIGAIAIETATGRVLVEDQADATVYPASVTKLMDMLLLLERIGRGTLHLSDQVRTTAEAARVGGSQVYLKEHEVFTIEELLYALMVQSANDAATALAIHTAGSTEAFVAQMNQKAQALGMKNTRFYSCHGLPPTPPRTPQEVDVSTPRDLAILARELLINHPEILRYTACVVRPFRNGSLIMRNHNRLLRTMPGVDGLKTGYFPAAGYSVVATAKRDGRRVIVVGAGSKARRGLARDKAATEIFARAFAALPPPPREPAQTNFVAAAVAATNPPPRIDPTTLTPAPSASACSACRCATAPAAPRPMRWYAVVGIVLAGVIIGAGGVAALMAWSRRRASSQPFGNLRGKI
jgi:D-alanyl-D-alanine carboxypeptidase (penicillin-binding protein 5/6)